MAISGRIGLTIDLEDIRATDAGSAREKISLGPAWDVVAGSGNGQANLMFADVRALADGANESLDLAGALANAFGAAVFTKVKAIAIIAAAANTTALTVSRGATTPLPWLTATAAIADLDAGDIFYLSKKNAGITVGAGTADLITITNASGAAASYTVVFVGLS